MKFIAIYLVLVSASICNATEGLVVHAVDFNLARFHRADNKLHPHDPSNSWTPYILPDGMTLQNLADVENADGSVTVFFQTLEDMMSKVVHVAQARNQKIALLNVHTHGAPGATVMPANKKILNSAECDDWRKPLNLSDSELYEAGITTITYEAIVALQYLADKVYKLPCSSNLADWQHGIKKLPKFSSVFAAQSELHFIGCMLGRGPAGQIFSDGISDLLFKDKDGSVYAPEKFGIGDFSTPDGMGFWDVFSKEQFKIDMKTLSEARRADSIRQNGDIRVVTYENGSRSTSILKDQAAIPMRPISAP